MIAWPSRSEVWFVVLTITLALVGCGVVVGRVTHGVSIDVTITKGGKR